MVQVSASDADSGVYGQITFSLATSSVPFRIDPNTGELTVDGNLDRETKDSYDLTIQATDGTLASCSDLTVKRRGGGYAHDSLTSSVNSNMIG